MEWLGDLTALHWLALAGGLLVLELMMGTMYLLWVAAAALLVALKNCAFPGSWESDLVLFAGLSTILLLFGHYVIRPRMKGDAANDLNEPANALIGRRVRAIADFQTGEGRVQLGDSQWRARTDDHITMGEELVVVAVEGSTLRVESRED